MTAVTAFQERLCAGLCGPRIRAVCLGRRWQRGQKWLLRPAITIRWIGDPQRGQGFPVF